jgi:cytochrome P450
MTKDPSDFQWDAKETQACPYPFYEALRTKCPVYETPGHEIYLLTKHSLLLEAVKRPQVFSNNRKSLGAGDPEFDAIGAQGYPEIATLTPNDPPAHTRYRRLINPFFTPKAIALLEPSIEQIVDDLIDGFIGDGECDFVPQFCRLMPPTVIADMLGVPHSRIPEFLRWAHAVEAATAQNLDREHALQAKRDFVEFQHFFADLIEQRRQQPGEDLVSRLVSSKLDGERDLEVPEILDYLRLIIAGGNLTTMGLLSSGMVLMLRHPDQFEAVRNDHSLIPQFVEEVIRYEAPAQWTPRTVKAPGGASIGGVHLPEGARMAMVWASANRDEDVFSEPDRFNIFRDDIGEHIAFAFGTHFCLGAALARAEGRIAFERLFTRLTDIECTIPLDDVKYHPAPIDHALETLPLRFVAA